ncbi:RAMP superfamily CRISPR-associated protein [Pseudanabaena sp. UWO310]|uniref:RAMP superfamily CRISPR-associated protein n=1 Tax=Pseudanabaena sp. UWO310 TaxID=2480795 RepID=UPI00115B8315|nr:RAMP superfamily CRISPR-associated protein [Pseudanabaena sp. UWO310]TYQ30422.1 RAMP superfamily protein [Pseudanabaena sp. UWO310]
MSNIPDAYKKVPMMFQAQTKGRCQLQFLDQARKADPKHNKPRESQDAEIWCEEWTSETYPVAPIFDEPVKKQEYTISWRFVTNSGQDDGVIRPVIGASGYPFYPGSSMKGAFRQACKRLFRDRLGKYCGQEISKGDFSPGILRFHGGYPVDSSWTDGLVDLIHPQQKLQVMNSEKEGAKVQISLYQPTIQFGISASEELDESEWEEIWQIWEAALGRGIGCRVSAGYGHRDQLKGELLYPPHLLKGQGMASKRLDESGEFRPNIFRAAIRGHALRIFGGLIDADTAEKQVEKIFGGVSGHGVWGLLMMNFVTTSFEPKLFGNGQWEVPSYKVEGELGWLLSQEISEEHKAALKNLILHLNQFAMIFGGFGKSWRRADHRLFYEEYYEKNNDRKPLIGCHWQWKKGRYARDIKVYGSKYVTSFLDKLQEAARVWLQLQGVKLTANYATGWREAWHPDKVMVWGRIASNKESSEAIQWLHGAYQKRDNKAKISELSIYKSSVTGRVGQIGRLWHRMYPLMKLEPDPNDSTKKIPKPTASYLELLTIFPDGSEDCLNFLKFLADDGQFKQLWGKPWKIE